MPASNPGTGSCWPTPRMKAVSVELVPREFSSVVLGAMLATSVMSIAPALDSVSADSAVTAIGTSISRSSRRRAVTMISALSSLLAPSSCCAKAAGVKASSDSALVAQIAVRRRRANGRM